jgi:hypothetical protein
MRLQSCRQNTELAQELEMLVAVSATLLAIYLSVFWLVFQ